MIYTCTNLIYYLKDAWGEGNEYDLSAVDHVN